MNADKQPAQSGIPTDAKARKGAPVFSGVIKYFPDALVAVAELSRVGNDQHNPGQPLHWAKEKSTDEPDALLRHLIDRARGDAFDTDGVRHLAKAAWRALAALQREIDAEQSSSKGSPTPTEVGTIIRSTEASAETAGRPLGRPE